MLSLVFGAAAAAQEAFDAPSDDGSGIAVVWPAAPGEHGEPGTVTPTYEYVVSIAAAGPFEEIARVPARAAWKRDLAQKFGLRANDSPEHAVIVTPLDVFSAEDAALAALGDTTATAKVRAALGDEAIARAKTVLADFKIGSLGGLNDYPRRGYVVDRIGRQAILDRAFKVKLAGGPRGERVFEGVRPEPNLFDGTKLNNLVVVLFLGGAVLAFILIARKNPNLYLRRIGGLDAIDEALGRATEMGKPILYVHGLETLQKVPTIAAINILGEVAKKVARYDTKLICTNYDPIVLTVSQETVREGFLRAGRPDAYNPDDVFLAGADQFSYVAAVDGIMIRQRPAANIYAGYFYAESLLLAETGAATGAIQIAATDAYTQLPFFVTTCDYTLMGEELYAASAYLSRDPMLLGSLRGQDVGKAAVMLYIILGTIAATAGIEIFKLLVKAS